MKNYAAAFKCWDSGSHAENIRVGGNEGNLKLDLVSFDPRNIKQIILKRTQNLRKSSHVKIIPVCVRFYVPYIVI